MGTKLRSGRFGKASAYDLDKDLESYWVKGGHSEFGKLTYFRLTNVCLATQRLDDDLASYFEKQEVEVAAEPEEEDEVQEEEDYEEGADQGDVDEAALDEVKSD